MKFITNEFVHMTEMAAMKLLGGGGGGGGGRGEASTSLWLTNPLLSSALVPQTLSCFVCLKDSQLISALS